jgi:hypothetical protein
LARATCGRFNVLLVISLGAMLHSVLSVLWPGSGLNWGGPFLLYGLYAWPPLILAALAFTGRRVWRAGGSTRIVGIGLATLALVCCVLAIAFLRALQEMYRGIANIV